jgi:hypothetical protein
MLHIRRGFIRAGFKSVQSIERTSEMKTTVDLNQFCMAFSDDGLGKKFSFEGRAVLFDYFEQLEQDTRQEMELDAVIAICCDFSESTPQEIADAYSIDLSDCDDEAEKSEAVTRYLKDQTSIAGETGIAIVYKQF